MAFCWSALLVMRSRNGHGGSESSEEEEEEEEVTKMQETEKRSNLYK